MVFEPLDFLARLAALIPYPRVNTVRFAGVYASRARLRKHVVPVSQIRDPLPCQGERAAPVCDGEVLTWSQLLARTFALDIFSCQRCGGRLTRIAVITDPSVIRKILRAVGLATDAPVSPPARPWLDSFDSQAA